MLALLPLAMEILAYLPQAIKLGVDLTDTAGRAVALFNAPVPATQEELAALKTAIDAEKAKLAAMTAELDQDPPA